MIPSHWVPDILGECILLFGIDSTVASYSYISQLHFTVAFYSYLLIRFAGLLKITCPLQLLANSWLLMLAVWITRHISPPSSVSIAVPGVSSPWCVFCLLLIPSLEITIWYDYIKWTACILSSLNQLSIISSYSFFKVSCVFPMCFRCVSGTTLNPHYSHLRVLAIYVFLEPPCLICT